MFSLCLSVCLSVVGDAKEIDWFAPNGEKLQPGRPDISVSKNDESSSTLTIYNANIDHAGMYKCVAKNGDKESQGTVIVKYSVSKLFSLLRAYFEIMRNVESNPTVTPKHNKSSDIYHNV